MFWLLQGARVNASDPRLWAGFFLAEMGVWDGVAGGGREGCAGSGGWLVAVAVGTAGVGIGDVSGSAILAVECGWRNGGIGGGKGIDLSSTAPTNVGYCPVFSSPSV